ncbi:hypothetical protein D9613_011060 [Agrocybe pediades]|uniref:F-box domain-containing protein n=1 Tax=Agrocybe pediades TaxID=84607 RepID=A0A8H4QL44_9AGAR|nr:hypothetical protein D9613_011060 [Agrocybe pediades]
MATQTRALVPWSNGTTFPAEVLCQIFIALLNAHSSELEDEDMLALPYIMDVDSVVSASQVCQYWRNVALSYRRLWARMIDIDHHDDPEWIKLLLERSGSNSLIIQSQQSWHGYGPDYSSPQWQLIFDELHRIKVLHIVMSSNFLGQIPNVSRIIFLMLRPAPVLESFRLSFRKRINDGNRRLPESINVSGFDRPLFAGVAPKLCDLVLQGFAITEPRSIFSSVPGTKLTHLHLDHGARSRVNYPASFWLCILEQQPHLEHLVMASNIFSPYTGRNHSPRQTMVRLPNLQHFELACCDVDCAEILTRLSFPDACALVLKLQYTGIAPETTTQAILSRLGKCFRSWIPAQRSCMHWRFASDNNGFKITAIRDHDDGLGRNPQFFLQHDIAVYVQSEPVESTIFEDCIDLLRESGVMQPTTALSFRHYGSLRRELLLAFTPLLKSCNNVRKLTLRSDETVTDFITTILAGYAAGCILLPKLEMLDLDRVYALDRFMENLNGYVLWRSTVDKPLKDLAFTLHDFKNRALLVHGYPCVSRIARVQEFFGDLQGYEASPASPQRWLYNFSPDENPF